MKVEILKYILFGFSFLSSLISFVKSNALWKFDFFKKCLISAIISACAGVFFESMNIFHLDRGLTVLIMFIPLIYLIDFQILRLLFKHWNRTEPYVTSASSGIGGTPLDTFSKDFKDGKKQKYPRERKIIISDFLFSFLQALIPIFTILILLLITGKLNK